MIPGILANASILADGEGFDLFTFLQNTIGGTQRLGGGILVLLGVIMIGVGGFRIGKGLLTQGKPQAQPINWFLCLGLLVVGGMLSFSGFKGVLNATKTIGGTVDSLSGAGDNEDAKLFQGTDVQDDADKWKP